MQGQSETGLQQHCTGYTPVHGHASVRDFDIKVC